MKNENVIWPEQRKAAVSLTYDDGLAVHREKVCDILQAHGIKATFYTPIRSLDLMANTDAWRTMAEKGHELGNHSIFHPCRRKGKTTLRQKCYDLIKYTPLQWREELEVANFTLRLIDDKHERTYGNNCCDTTIGEGENEESMDPILNDLFVAARGSCNSQIFRLNGEFNPMQINHFSGDGKTFELIKSEILKAQDVGGWIIYMIHGVGEGTHNLFIDPQEHLKLINWLAENKNNIWTAPFIEIARYVKTYSFHTTAFK